MPDSSRAASAGAAPVGPSVRIESISPFLVVEELKISESKSKKGRRGTLVHLIISSLLGDIPTAQKIEAEETGETIEISRNIFVSDTQQVYEAPKLDFRLEGISYNPAGPTAIINGEVKRKGSQVQDFTIKDILIDKVVLTDGFQDFEILIEK